MEYCPSCDNVLLVRRSRDVPVLYCACCGYEKPIDPTSKPSYTIVTKVHKTGKEKTAVVNTTINAISITADDRETIDWMDAGEWPDES